MSLLPTSGGAVLGAFLSRSASQQERALLANGSLPVQSAEFSAFYAGLDSIYAREDAQIIGCYMIAANDTSDWREVVSPYLNDPVLTIASTGYAFRGPDFGARLFGSELADTAAHIDVTNADRLEYLMSFDYGEASFDIFSKLAANAPSLQLREDALRRLSAQTQPEFGYSPPANLDTWRSFFRARLAAAQSKSRFDILWRGALALHDRDSLVIGGQKLHSLSLSEAEALAIACDAYALAAPGSPEWTTFRDAAQPSDSLPPKVKAYLEKPTTCTTTTFPFY